MFYGRIISLQPSITWLTAIARAFGIVANKEKAEALEKRGAELEAECKEEIVKVKAK